MAWDRSRLSPGNAFFAMELGEVNTLIGSFFGHDAIHTPILTTLERARDLLRAGQTVAVQRMLDRLSLPPVSPNGQRFMRVIAERHALAVLDVPVTTEQTGTPWNDNDVENFARLHDDLWPRTQALEKIFNPGLGWDPAKHPRWPSGQSEGGQFRPNEGSDGGASPILPAAAKPKKPQPKPASQTKAWENYPNSEMREKLAELESSADKPNNGYGEKPKHGKALGRYQFLPLALIDAGWKNKNGSWSEKAKEAGVSSDKEFLASPEAQEEALTDLLQSYTKELKTNGAYAKVGSTIQDSAGKPLIVTESGLIAAAHKEGPKSVAIYLDPRRRATLNPDKIRNIEHRLRDAAGIPYDAAATAQEANTSRRGRNEHKR
jgi:hypothetical protein